MDSAGTSREGASNRSGHTTIDMAAEDNLRTGNESPPAYSEDEGVEHEPPPLLVKLTAYRLVTLLVIVTFGTVKAVQSLRGDDVTATWLEWVAGAFAAVILYWIGLYEKVRPPAAPWFFHVDYTLDLFYIPFGGVLFCILSPTSPEGDRTNVGFAACMIFIGLWLLYLYCLGFGLLFCLIPQPTPDGSGWKYPVAVLLIIVLSLAGFSIISALNTLILAGLLKSLFFLVTLGRNYRDSYRMFDFGYVVYEGYCRMFTKKPILYPIANVIMGFAISIPLWMLLPIDKLPYMTIERTGTLS